jgi:hypothetical protein
MRPLSGKEMKELIVQKPEIFTDALGSAATDFKADEIAAFKQDSAFLVETLKLKELLTPLLQKLFPNAHFYQLCKLDIRPHYPYLIAIIGNKLYQMPSEFNQLLLQHNLKVNDRNIIELAKAFVIIALEGHEITFLESKRIREERMIGKKKNVTYIAQLKEKVGEEFRTWHLPQDIYEKNQFGGAALNNKDDKVIETYRLLVIETNQK